MFEKVVGLGGAGGGGGLGKMVTTPDEASIGSLGIVIAEAGISVGGALSSLSSTLAPYLMVGIRKGVSMNLDDHEARAISIGFGKIDGGLVVGDVESWNGCAGHRGKSCQLNGEGGPELHDDML